MADDERSPEEEFQELLRQLMGGGTGGLDPEILERLTGMGIDPAMMQTMMSQLRGAFAAGDGGISWDLAKRQALHIANQDGHGVTSGERTELDQAFALSSLWLSEATAIPDLPSPPVAMTRGGWVEATLDVWQELAEPVATSMADAMTSALREQAPEEMQGLVQGAGRVMRTVGGSLFATQLGQVVGALSKEVVSGGDVGIPIMPAGEAAILPQNFADFGRDLEIPEDQLALAIATRELAHARLFRHAKWLRLHVISHVGEAARGVRVDTDKLEDLASRFDAGNPQELQELIAGGGLLERTEGGTTALARLEDLLATIEGWVEVVTADALARIPSASRISEVVRRRRAVGGPAEQALSTLVGLELRPRRMREASAMWRAVTDAVGVAARDALWDYPDLMPTSEDIDEPAGLIARLEARARGDEPVRDEFDDALAALLAEESAGHDDASDTAVASEETGPDDSGTAGDADAEGPEGPRAV